MQSKKPAVKAPNKHPDFKVFSPKTFRMQAIAVNANKLLTELITTLQKIDSETYQSPVMAMSNATVGQHVRHIIDFYHCLLQQLPSRVINYDQRKRIQELELSPQSAIQALSEISSGIRNIDLLQELDLATGTEGKFRIKSNAGRELHYLTEHTIHHMALIKTAIKILNPVFQISDKFGVSPSTITYRETLKNRY